MDPLDLVAVADRIGIVAFAVSGVAVGIRAKLDLYGLIALGLVTAIGGGVTRDIVIGDIPRSFVTTDYLLFAMGATLAGILARALGWDAPGLAMKVADSLGTGAFAATGALLAWGAGLDWPAGIILAVLTATGGGVLRDVLAGEIPQVLHRGLNATGSAIGGGVTLLIVGTDPTIAALAGGTVGMFVTAAGHTERVRLPKI